MQYFLSNDTNMQSDFKHAESLIQHVNKLSFCCIFFSTLANKRSRKNSHDSYLEKGLKPSCLQNVSS